jgi:hypothetical protein
VGGAERDVLFSALQESRGSGYIDAIRSLSATAKAAGTAWLQAIVDSVCDGGQTILEGQQSV